MASVCGGCLALMDAGVPVKSSVAGIAMGMLVGDKGGVSDENAVILSDILGTEDALGTMDFKVAGDREGITTFQLDIKCEGLTFETMERALAQAREGRLHILDEMDKVLSSPRKELPPSVPKMSRFSIPAESIGKVIGPGGRQIRAVIEDFALVNMDVGEDGSIQLTSMEAEKLTEAESFVKALVAGSDGASGGRRDKRAPRPKYQGPDPEEGAVYTGKVTGIHSWGVFVEIMSGAEDGSYPGLEGLCHISELHTEHVRNCEGFVNSLNTDELEVKYLGINDKGQLRLSRKAVLEEKLGSTPRIPKSEPDPPKRDTTSPQLTMSKDEVDVIVQAIEGVQDL
jgi:polyribonucleotide nucleotidyltransferase